MTSERLLLADTADECVEVLWGQLPLFTYVYRVDAPRSESPKPYLHPVRTLSGDVITGFRPEDHVWHKGVQMTAPNLSGQNFWGGGTYVHGSGYVDLPNNGTMEHVEWKELETDGTAARLVERLTWRTAAGEVWIEERRTIEVPRVDSSAGVYQLSFTFQLRNLASHDLVFASPAIEGRPDAGYGGLFWRGPDSFVGGRIIAAGGLGGTDIMGSRAQWLAFTGCHDSGSLSTLIFIDDTTNLRYPTEWFVRTSPIACVSPALAFSERLTLPAADELTFRHALVVAAGDVGRADIERLVAAAKTDATADADSSPAPKLRASLS
ncbi:MAG: PmoA family protein [Actinobacteria bacterium]|nr:PmoA family protein [Actinomycetota bacterium]